MKSMRIIFLLFLLSSSSCDISHLPSLSRITFKQIGSSKSEDSAPEKSKPARKAMVVTGGDSESYQPYSNQNSFKRKQFHSRFDHHAADHHDPSVAPVLQQLRRGGECPVPKSEPGIEPQQHEPHHCLDTLQSAR